MTREPASDAQRVAVLYLCTGQYVRFWPEFYDNVRRNFLPECRLEFIVFTDAERLSPIASDVRVVPEPARPWPEPTLFRYQTFLRVESVLREYDFLFFLNANVICARAVSGAEILPREEQGEKLVVVTHPGFFDRPASEATYERDPRSTAHVSIAESGVYVCGGINGGTTDAFLSMAQTLADRISADYDRGVVALWHDESHLNRYILGRSDYRLLGPEFCSPEDWDGPFDPVLRLRVKRHVIDEAGVKGWPTQSDVRSVARRVLRRLTRLAKR